LGPISRRSDCKSIARLTHGYPIHTDWGPFSGPRPIGQGTSAAQWVISSGRSHRPPGRFDRDGLGRSNRGQEMAVADGWIPRARTGPRSSLGIRGPRPGAHVGDVDGRGLGEIIPRRWARCARPPSPGRRKGVRAIRESAGPGARFPFQFTTFRPKLCPGPGRGAGAPWPRPHRPPPLDETERSAAPPRVPPRGRGGPVSATHPRGFRDRAKIVPQLKVPLGRGEPQEASFDPSPESIRPGSAPLPWPRAGGPTLHGRTSFAAAGWAAKRLGGLPRVWRKPPPSLVYTPEDELFGSRSGSVVKVPIFDFVPEFPVFPFNLAWGLRKMARPRARVRSKLLPPSVL